MSSRTLFELFLLLLDIFLPVVREVEVLDFVEFDLKEDLEDDDSIEGLRNLLMGLLAFVDDARAAARRLLNDKLELDVFLEELLLRGGRVGLGGFVVVFGSSSYSYSYS